MNSNDPVDIERDPQTGDMLFPIRLARGSLGVAQRATLRLKLFLGEWFKARENGVPYFERLLGHKFSLQVAQQTIREQLRLCPDVSDILAVDINFTSVTRDLQIGFTMRTSFGDVISQSLEVQL